MRSLGAGIPTEVRISKTLSSASALLILLWRRTDSESWLEIVRTGFKEVSGS